MENTFDIKFTHDLIIKSEKVGLKKTFEYCLKYIQLYNGSNETNFANYKNGTVCIIDSQTENIVYSEMI